MAIEFLAIVEEKLFSLLDGFVREDSDSVISIHHQDLNIAVRARTVVCEPDLPSKPEKVCVINNLFDRH